MPKKRQSLVPRRIAHAIPGYKNHAYINPDGSVDGEKLLSIVRRMPGGFAAMMLDAMVERDKIPAEYHEQANTIIERLCHITLLAAYGDEECEVLLTAIRKIAQPRTYEVPQNKIKEITRYETSPPLARAWELHRIMSLLGEVVEPRNAKRPFAYNHPIRLKETCTAVFQGLHDLARKHLHPNSTLQSLAIRIYLETLSEQRITGERATITERTLKRDLDLAREWEANTSEQEKSKRGRWHGGKIGDLKITWYEFSEGWKVRAKEKAFQKEGGSTTRKHLT